MTDFSQDAFQNFGLGGDKVHVVLESSLKV